MTADIIVIIVLALLILKALYGIYKLISWGRSKDSYFNLGG